MVIHRKHVAAWVVAMTAVGAQAKEPEQPTGLTPSVRVQQKYTDNVYHERKNERHSWITTVKPGAELVMMRGVQKFTLGANTEGGYYTIDSRNDYVDWSGYARGELEFDPRNHFDAGIKRSHGHDPIGTGASEGFVDGKLQDEPDEFSQTDGDFKYTYGAKGARGKIVLRDIYLNKEYTNNRETTARLDRTDNELRATTYLRVMPKTTALLEVREKSIDYLKPFRAGSGMMDSDETRIYAGAEWEATAKTTGSVRVGHMEKDFREKHGIVAPVDDYDAPSWETSITWQPLSYSGFTLDLERGPTEASTGNTFIDRTDTRLTWQHDWTSYMSSRIFARRYSDEYAGTARTDDVEGMGAGLSYALNKWVDLSADYVYEDKNSTFNEFDYNGSLIVFGARLAID